MIGQGPRHEIRTKASLPLLGESDPAPFRVVNPGGPARLLLTCDHASRAVPGSLDHLGLQERDLQRHIGWDPGAAEVTQRLARRFNAPAVLSGYSRLVVDCNRRPDADDFIPEVSDGTVIPRNLDLSLEEVRRRTNAVFRPYHEAISGVLRGMMSNGGQPAFVGIHSFTPRMNGFSRPWHFGVLWDGDPRVAVPLMGALRASTGIVVGDNQPYSALDQFDYSREHHAASRGIPCALVEIRSDLLADDPGVTRCTDLVEKGLRAALLELQAAEEST